MRISPGTAANPKHKFSDEQIDAVRNIDILTLARQEHFELNKEKNGTYKARKGGGLFFFPDTNTYCCNARDRGGSTINFIMDYRNVVIMHLINREIRKDILVRVLEKRYNQPS